MAGSSGVRGPRLQYRHGSPLAVCWGTMAAYVIVEIEVHDPIRYEEYRRMAGESLKTFGGRFVVRGGRAERLEGEGDPKRVVVLEFESLERARAWHSSDAYRPARALRQEVATARMILVEGVA